MFLDPPDHLFRLFLFMTLRLLGSQKTDNPSLQVIVSLLIVWALGFGLWFLEIIQSINLMIKIKLYSI